MKKALFIIIPFLSLAVACDRNDSGNDLPTGGESSLVYSTESIADHDAIVVKPAEIDDDAPVVILLTGDLTLRSFNESPKINFKAAEHCLIGRYTLCVIAANDKEDVSFLSSVKEAFPAASKYYLLSYRNGLSYAAAMQMPDAFDAFGCVSGAIDVDTYGSGDFQKPVSFVHVHAVDNSVCKWCGTQNDHVSVPLSVGAVVAIDKCISFKTSDLLPRDGEGRVSCISYFGGKSGCDVKLYRVESADSGWCDAEFEVYNEVWNFFKTH